MFLQIMKNALIEKNTQETAGRLLFESVTLELQTDISPKMLNYLVKRTREVPDAIKKAAARPKVIANTIHYFEDVVLPDLNPHLKDDSCSKIIRLLNEDASVPKFKYDELANLYNKGQIAEFLALSFLYAISRPNKKTEISSGIDDTPLIYEANNKCPLCHKPLIKTVKGQPIKKYSVVDINPKQALDNDEILLSESCQVNKMLKSIDAKIALCTSCADEYLLSTEQDEVLKLLHIKAEYTKHTALLDKVSAAPLEFEIRDVILELSAVDVEVKEDYKLNVMKIDQKIHPKNILLMRNLKNDVLRYYRFIEDIFSRIDNFEEIASEINATFYKIEKVYETQEEVVYYLAEWILEKTNLSKAHHPACSIIVAFFVQNCEVFYEIA